MTCVLSRLGLDIQKAATPIGHKDDIVLLEQKW
jgi:hypothetical protein